MKAKDPREALSSNKAQSLAVEGVVSKPDLGNVYLTVSLNMYWCVKCQRQQTPLCC